MSLGLLLASALAWADPAGLREPGELAATFDDDAAGLGAWLSPQLGAWASWSWPAESLTLGGALRQPVWSRGTWAIETYLAGGVIVPLRAPGIGATVGPSAQLRTRGSRLIASVDLSAPLAARVVPGQELAISAVVTPRLGFRAGPIWTTAHLDVGATWTHRLDTRVLLRTGLALSVSPGRQE